MARETDEQRAALERGAEVGYRHAGPGVVYGAIDGVAYGAVDVDPGPAKHDDEER